MCNESTHSYKNQLYQISKVVVSIGVFFALFDSLIVALFSFLKAQEFNIQVLLSLYKPSFSLEKLEQCQDSSKQQDILNFWRERKVQAKAKTKTLTLLRVL